MAEHELWHSHVWLVTKSMLTLIKLHRNNHNLVQCCFCSHEFFTSVAQTAENVFSQTENKRDVLLQTAIPTLAKINFHQRSSGDSLPASPGSESSVIWREKHQEAEAESTEVDVSDPCVTFTEMFLRSFSPELIKSEGFVASKSKGHTKAFKSVTFHHFDYYSGISYHFYSVQVWL